MKRRTEQNYSNGYFPGNPQNMGYMGNDPSGAEPTGTDGRIPYRPGSDMNGKNKRKKKRRTAAAAVVLCLVPLLIFAAVKIIENNRKAAEEQRIYNGKVDTVNRYAGIYADNVYIDGVSIGGMTPDQAVAAVADNLARRQNSWYLNICYQGHTFLTLNYSLMGINFDTTALNNALNEAFRIGHTGDLEKDFSDLTARENSVFEFNTAQSTMNTSALDSYLAQIADNVYADATDAMLIRFTPDDADPFTIQPETYGRRLDTAAAKDQIISMMMNGISGDFELTPDIVRPAVTETDVRNTVSLLGTGETPVNSASTENRTNNIRLAFSKFNGKIMEPNESFSFNTVCGKRTTRNGYLEAAAYVNNEVAMEIGGGVCQASSTLYVATRLSNLNVTHREPHSMAVNYTDYGLDATVNSTGKIIDFNFVNNTGGRIYITAHVEPTKNKKQPYKCIVRIYGPAFEPGVSYKMRTEEVELISGSELPRIYRYDDGTFGLQYTDQEKLYKAAVDGHVVATYLQKLQDGHVIEETKVSVDKYPAQAEIYYRGSQARPAE